jgi:hypothetical protein
MEDFNKLPKWLQKLWEIDRSLAREAENATKTIYVARAVYSSVDEISTENEYVGNNLELAVESLKDLDVSKISHLPFYYGQIQVWEESKCIKTLIADGSRTINKTN